MSAVAERPIIITAVPRQRATEKDACALALSYQRWASACWRPALPPKPTSRPDVISPHGGGGRDIHWYQTDDEVLGYVPGAAGGYQVPVSSIPQLVRRTHTPPGRTLDGSLDELGMPHWS